MNGRFSMWARQIASVIRLEMSKTFFARRGLWIYLLALAPVAIFTMHATIALARNANYRAAHDRNPVTREQLTAIPVGSTPDEVRAELGEPYEDLHVRRGRFPVEILTYSDGHSLFVYTFVTPPQLEQRDQNPFGFGKGKGKEGPPPAEKSSSDQEADQTMRLDRTTINEGDSLTQDSLIFATVFQFFFLRLAVFFGCVGVFTNLFRGELLDKSLHFYLLAPMRREVLMIGKYLAGLIATSVIFCTSAALQLAVMGLHQDSAELSNYLNGPGWGHVFAYLGVTLAACVGYGSVFLAAGLLVRNPILPAAAVLIWEGMNIFLPATLKKISIIYYLQSLCPVVAPPDSSVPQVLRLLITNAEPTPVWLAVTGLVAVSMVLLLIAGRKARRLEINYGAE